MTLPTCIFCGRSRYDHADGPCPDPLVPRTEPTTEPERYLDRLEAEISSAKILAGGDSPFEFSISSHQALLALARNGVRLQLDKGAFLTHMVKAKGTLS